jgi:hypothetical protein
MLSFLIEETNKIAGDRLKVLECGASDGAIYNSCAIVSGTGQSNSSGQKQLFQRWISAIAQGQHKDLEETGTTCQLMPGWKEVAAATFLLGNNVIALKSPEGGYLGNFSGSNNFSKSFVKGRLLNQFITDKFLVFDPFAPFVLHARSGGNTINSSGHVQQIMIDSRKQTWNPLWYYLNSWSIVIQFEKTASLTPLITQLKELKRFLDQSKAKARSECTMNCQLKIIEEKALTNTLRNPEQLASLIKMGLWPADLLDLADPIPDYLSRAKKLEEFKRQLPEIMKSNLAQEMKNVPNKFPAWKNVTAAAAVAG